MTGATPDELIVLGRITGLYGVRGWVKVFSHTQPRENILGYPLWLIGDAGQWRSIALEDGRVHGKGVVAKLKGCDDRDAAAALMGQSIAIRREQLPPAPEGEYYWADLLGLAVSNLEGVSLGVVEQLLETGANDVLVVVQDELERLIPFVQGQFVKEIDLANRRLIVDWDPEF
ncbi:MAG: ribosome maturation factor RimM [Chromatiales bacterium]|nr:ribosome maturation factor RimM [Gammaproteobacteria bacterium]MBW6476176.1 ribosome maturation factor RimM [Chromatiales bacterium]